MKGPCTFDTSDHDYFSYDHDVNYFYAHDTDGNLKCLEWCEKQAKLIDHAVGCYYGYDYYDFSPDRCIFLKSGIITEEKVTPHEDGNVTDICWKFESGNTSIFLHGVIIIHQYNIVEDHQHLLIILLRF